MSWTIRFDEPAGLIEITSHGVLDSDGVRAKCHDIIDAIERHGVQRVLVDDRDMRPEISTVDIYRLPDLFSARRVDRAVRAAVVIGPESTKKADYGFLETVAYNSGYQVRLFTDMDAARQWLKA